MDAILGITRKDPRSPRQNTVQTIRDRIKKLENNVNPIGPKQHIKVASKQKKAIAEARHDYKLCRDEKDCKVTGCKRQLGVNDSTPDRHPPPLSITRLDKTLQPLSLSLSETRLALRLSSFSDASDIRRFSKFSCYIVSN